MRFNFSNNSITTQEIEGLLAAFEGRGLFEMWADNVMRPDLSPAKRAELKRNFPRSNPFREVILKLGWSIPVPNVEPGHDLKEGERKVLAPRIKELSARREWEGNMTFTSALLWWRLWLLVTGDTFVKLPMDYDDEGELCCFPERLPSARTYIKMDPKVRKLIDGFRFQYFLGTGMYTERGDMSVMTTETISRDEWTIETARVEVGKDGDITKKQVLNQNEVDTVGMLRVVHMAWEASEDSPRGIPLAKRLLEKTLHVWTTALDRRLGNKMGSVPMYKLKNSTGDMPPIAAGVVVSLKTEVPFAEADFAAVPTEFSDESLQREYKDARRELFEEAFLPFDEDKEGGVQPSGKALQMLNSDQVKYREAFQTHETSFLQDLFSKALTLEGEPVESDDLDVKYDGLVTPDKGQQLSEAQFLWTAGLEKKSLTTLGIEEDEADTLLADLETKRTDDLLNAAAAMDQGTQEFDAAGQPVKQQSKDKSIPSKGDKP